MYCFTGKPPWYKYYCFGCLSPQSWHEWLENWCKIFTTEVKGRWQFEVIKNTPTQVILINWILTKLPVADCHPKCKCYQFCLGLQLQRAVSFSVGWCSPGLNVWTPSEVEYLWIPWYSCMLAGWIDAESQRIDREMEVGTEGRMKR